ncbi:MAG: hypothetical protein FD170_3938 [Bacteroidetes bacterium]|nr:MAG: hypothetical protein FD170_3938 [Bacteroidota bacterium]
MKTYSLTSPHFTGEVLFQFNDVGLLLSYDAKEATLSEKQQVYLLRHLPRELSEVKNMLEKSPDAKFEEVKLDITFELFWKRYNAPLNSKKKAALARWNRMSQSERNRAYYFIHIYESRMQPGVAKMYAETYLNSELWNN